MKLFNVKTFEDRYNPNKKFHHFNILGLKFRVANNKRTYRTRWETVYKTERGIVFNGLDNRYLCLITKR